MAFFTSMNMTRFAGDSARIVGLASALRTQGVNVLTFLPENRNPELSARFAPFVTYRIPTPNVHFLRFVSLSFLNQYLIPQKIVDSTFDIVQIEGALAPPFSKIRRMAHRNDVLFDMHSIIALDLEPYLPSVLKSPVARALLAIQDYLCRKSECLVVSHRMKEYILQRLDVDPKRIHVIPNGVDLKVASHAISRHRHRYEFLSDGSDPLLVYVGGLEWYEGVDLAIKALSELKRTYPRAHLAIAGRGTDEKSLKILASRLELTDSVTFLGWIPYEDTFALQAVADILVAARKPLRKRGNDISAPMKIPSYLSAGKPIVSSSVGEIPFVARHMKEALLVTSLTGIAFADAIVRLWSDSELRKKLSRQSSIRAKEYSWVSIAKQLRNLYLDILNR